MGEDSDESLMQRIGSGDAGAFRALCRRYADLAYAIAFRALRRREDAEDVVQDCCLKIWRTPRRFDNKRGRFRPWFCRMVVNAAIDRGRGQRLLGSIEDDGLDIVSDTPSPEDAAITRQRYLALHTAVADLPERQRQAVILFYTADLSQRDIAEALGTSEGGVEGLLLRARRTLARRLG